MAKAYPLEVESIGANTYIVISRGHHEIHEFMRAVREYGYDWPLGEPTHLWMKTRPAGKSSDYSCFYGVVPEGTRGAWPATHTQEAWSEDSYEAKHLTQPPSPTATDVSQYSEPDRAPGEDGFTYD